jgi:2-keto-4-pentenoate hydratase
MSLEIGTRTETIWNAGISGRLDGNDLVGRWSVEDGERIQLALLDLKEAAGDTRVGWKVGLTSGRARNAFGPGIRPFGHILKSHLFRSGEHLSLAGVDRPDVETELCFRMGRRLAGSDVTTRDVRAAVRSVVPAFEIVEDRLRGSSDPGLRIADDLWHWGLVLGDEERDIQDPINWRGLVSTVSRDDQLLQRVEAEGHIDDHFESLASLVRELARFDLGLEPEDVVITGSFTRQSISSPGRYTGVFEGLGSVSVTVS